MLLTLFRVVTDRVKAMFVTNAAMEFEAEFVARDAERRAELLRQADRYDAEGLTSVASRLRQQSESLNTNQPLANILPSAMHLIDTEVCGFNGPTLFSLPARDDNAPMKALPAATTKRRRK